MGERHVVIDIETRIKAMMDEQNETFRQKHSIYKIPAYIKERETDYTNAYKPNMVSLGPYHHGDPSLKPMQKHKEYAMSCFLNRSEKLIEPYIQALMKPTVLQSLRDSYDQLEECWQDDKKFVEMMIVDGCFILEVILNICRFRLQQQHGLSDVGPRHGVHPIFSSHGQLNFAPSIMLDMLVLENQLPLLVLYKLVKVDSGPFNMIYKILDLLDFSQVDDSQQEITEKLVVNISIVVSCALCKLISLPTISNLGVLGRKYRHMLDLFRAIMTGELERKVSSTQYSLHSNNMTKEKLMDRLSSSFGNDKTPSAVQLHKAGIHIRNNKSKCISSISFSQGTLELPTFVVRKGTETIFLNLMAFECLHVGVTNHITSCICFMDNIIDSEEDIAVLQKRGIIANTIGSNKDAASLFESMAKHTWMDPRVQLYGVSKEINAYYDKSWIKWRADLYQTYFRSPWALIALVGALLLFALTFTQTIYTVYPFYHPRKP